MTRQIEERVGEVQRTLRVLAGRLALGGTIAGPVSKPILEEAMTEAADLLDELLLRLTPRHSKTEGEPCKAST